MLRRSGRDEGATKSHKGGGEKLNSKGTLQQSKRVQRAEWGKRVKKQPGKDQSRRGATRRGREVRVSEGRYLKKYDCTVAPRRHSKVRSLRREKEEMYRTIKKSKNTQKGRRRKR